MIRYFVIVCLVGFGLFLSASSNAQTCGFMACEEMIATHAGPPNQFHGVAGTHQCTIAHPTCTAAGVPTTSIGATFHWVQGGTPRVSCEGGFAPCNCAARPNVPTARMFTNSIGEGGVTKCNAGCTMVPIGDVAVDKWMATPGGGSYVALAPGGWRHDGSQCNPLGAGSNPEPTGQNCTMAGDAQICLDRKPDPPRPPKICLQYQGQEICEGDPNACKGGSAVGFLCQGAPNTNTPSPPDPPTGPAPTRPPDIKNPCVINGVPCEARYWKPPFGDAPCPDGQTRDSNGNCVPNTDPEPPRCPDGQPPQNGACPAPYADCADGTRPSGNPPVCHAPLARCPDGSMPVRGQCPAVGGTCPNGAQPVNGQCTATYSPCANGAQPVGGVCQAGYAPCPNGSQPVNGMCQTGAGCDPLTDPEQCTGNEDGHASGGETCAGQPACSGDPVACAILQMQWRHRCETKEALTGEGDPGDAIEDMQAEGTFTWGPSEEIPGGGLGMSNGFDDSGFGLSRSCPQVPPISVMGTTVEFPAVWCDLLAMMGTLLLIGASWAATKIVASA